MSDSLKEICAEMWFKYEPGLRGYCRAKLVNYKEDADDVLSKTFQIFWAKLIKDGMPPYPEKWLYKTANNLIKEEYRKQEKDNANLAYRPAAGEATLYCTDDVDDHTANEQLYKALIAQLNEELSEDEKLMIKYAVLEERSYGEIAELLDISADAAKQRKFRLMRKTHRMKQEKKKKLGFF